MDGGVEGKRCGGGTAEKLENGGWLMVGFVFLVVLVVCVICKWISCDVCVCLFVLKEVKLARLRSLFLFVSSQ